MSGPYAEGGPLPPVDREALAEHEERIARWREQKRIDDAVDVQEELRESRRGE
jgi:hypothetical protein